MRPRCSLDGWRPNPCDVLHGFVLGEWARKPRLPPARGVGARAALEQVVLDALRRPPCAVSFSGGRDSAAVLAVAAEVARREGLDLPLPVTLAYPGVEGADESEWQETVIRHLGLRHWERLETGAALEFLGPVATDVLTGHGLLWPANTYFHRPLLEVATGGSLLTGVDGDMLLGGWRWARDGGVVPTARSAAGHLVERAFAVLPLSTRAALTARRWRPAWVTDAGWEALAAYRAETRGVEPWRWDRRVSWWSRRRYLETGARSLDLLAADAGVDVRHPLQDPRFLTELARDGGARGYPDRTRAMAHLFGDVLPRAVIERQSKAYFDRVMWGRRTREFARSWDGSGVDPALVDVEALRSGWLSDTPHFGSVLLLHSAWLEASGVGSDGTDG